MLLAASASDVIFYLLFAFTIFAVVLSVGLALFALAWTVTGSGSRRTRERTGARLNRAPS